MKKTLFTALILSALLCTACSTGDNSSAANSSAASSISESAETAVNVIRNNATTKWKSSERIFDFNTDGSGDTTTEGTDTYLAIKYKISGNEITVNFGSEDTAEKATVEVKDDNTIVLKWSDGKEETLTLSTENAVSVIRNDTATKWKSGDRTFEFNTDGSGSISDNGADTAIPINYELIDTELTVKSGSEDNIETAIVHVKDDNTIVLKWSDNKEETLTLA